MTASARPKRPLFGSSRAASLVTGALVFRWVWLLWMTGLAAAGHEELRNPLLAWSSIGVAFAWTLWLSIARSSRNRLVMVIDVALSVWLVGVSAFVVAEGGIISGRPFFATGYPLSTPLLWGAIGGPLTGAATAALLAVAHLLTRPLNGVPLGELDPGQVQNVTGAMLNYFVGGVAVGLVARLLKRSEEAVWIANEEAIRERELGARLAERESLARAIHDSVLQSLALVHKRGKEIAARPEVDPRDVADLADIAGSQQEELRALILRAPTETPTGKASLRDSLEEMARRLEGLSVEVSATGPLVLPRATVDEICAAVRQGLENVRNHSGVTKATVFIEEDDGHVVTIVRDSGKGFSYDEDLLGAQGKVGLLKSIKGRVEDLGGSMRVSTAPGKGTEIELRVPMKDG